MIIRTISLSIASVFIFSSIAQADDTLYPDLTCGQLVEMDSAEQEKAINWLNGYVEQDNLQLERLANTPYSTTVDACKTQSDHKVVDIIRHEH